VKSQNPHIEFSQKFKTEITNQASSSFKIGYIRSKFLKMNIEQIHYKQNNAKDSFLSLSIHCAAQFKYLLLTALILLSSFQKTEGQFSSHSTISILTCAPGDELYSLFGHTAIRIKDTTQHKDVVFNYGTFDFNTPNFYLKFMRGELNYLLSVSNYKAFIREYRYHRRSVVEQTLNLTPEEIENIIYALMVNSQPQNREYLYHFFYDNCATRIRDVVADNLNGDVHFPALTDSLINMTYRDAINNYLTTRQWIQLGLNIILGQPTDEVLSPLTIQFLPDYLHDQFGTATKADGVSLVESTDQLLNYQPQKNKNNISPAFVFWGLLLLLGYLTWWEYKNNRFIKWLNVVLFLIISIIGCLIVFLWFFTLHLVTGPNWHLLWANPLYFMAIIALFQKQNRFHYLLLLLAGFNIIMLSLVMVLPQHLSLLLIPVWLLMALRLVAQWFYYQKTAVN
jgi:hypothetical protein